MSDTGATSDREEERANEPRTAGAPRRTVGDRTATLNAANADLLRQVERLERSNAELAAFGPALAHDLSEGMATIAYFADALAAALGSDLDEATRQHLDGIRAGVERSQALISGAMQTAEHEADAGPARPVDTNAVLRDALANLRARRELAGAKVSAEPLPPVSGNGSELVRLFQNLLANAIGSRDPSRPSRISVGSRRQGRRWRFAITDNGIGIDPDGGGGDPAEPQLGIGLAICRWIVARHGGRFQLEPGPGGRGTTVSFDLPAVEGAGSRRG
jgi:light-regulated signal transduction histidine kinase (bacteriophytochrome)